MKEKSRCTTISYDNKSFLLNGKRVYLNSAAIHYFRMPKEEWREVLVKAKLAGNLGRYWQIGPQEDYKIPLAWLQDHNELVIFDEEGRQPEKVKLLYDNQSDWHWISVG